MIPGFDRDDDADTTAEVDDPDSTTVIDLNRTGSDHTRPLPRAIDDTMIEETQVIPPEDPEPPTRRRSSRRRR